MERILEEIAELAIIDPSYAEVLQAVVAREVDLPTLAKAHRRGEVTMVRLLVANPALSEVVARHLEIEKERGAYFGYKQILEVAPENARLSWIRSPQNIERALNDIERKRGQKRNSVLRYMGRAVRKLLRREFGPAEMDRIWSEVTYQRVDDARRVSLSIEEIHRLLNACTTEQYRAYILAIIFTGADRAVMLRVKRRDLEIWVEKGVYRGKVYLNDGKNESRPRTVGLSHRVAKALAEQAADKEPHEPIFTLGYHGLGKTWRVVRDRAGLSDLRIKDLRHVFAGLGLDADGVSLAALKGGLGHARLETTMRYADRDMAFDSKHAALIEDLVFGPAVNG